MGISLGITDSSDTMESIKYLAVIAILGTAVITECSGAGPCKKPDNWCFDGESKFTSVNHFQWIDCDGDGIPDPTCTNKAGEFFVIYSSQSCRESSKEVNGPLKQGSYPV